jgi:hypothetical protein
MHHNDVVDLLGTCPCGCHRRHAEGCWCRDARQPDPLEISHNDRVRYLGGCQCRGRSCTNRSTSPEVAHALQRKESDRREQRIRNGRPQASDLTHIVRNPGRYPHYFR